MRTKVRTIFKVKNNFSEGFQSAPLLSPFQANSFACGILAVLRDKWELVHLPTVKTDPRTISC